jgi:hypothetical protein
LRRAYNERIFNPAARFCSTRWATGWQQTFDRLGPFPSGKHDPVDFALRLSHKDVGLGREPLASDPERIAAVLDADKPK